MKYDHEAIRKAYPDVVTINNATGAFKKDGSKVELVQSEIDSARATLDAEAAANKYKSDRQFDGAKIYPNLSEQFDKLFRDVASGKFGDAAKDGEWYISIKEVKDSNPKPS
tara:strand:+ start:559 stop:891 length:333 start_codon:yes stop_codon:yes gene_type:complete